MARAALHKVIYWGILLIAIFPTGIVSGQVPEIPVPRRSDIGRYDPSFQSPAPEIPSDSRTFSQKSFIQRQNEAIMLEVAENERKREVANRHSRIREYLKTNEIPLPDFSGAAGTEFFHNARNEILEMLEGKRKLSLKRAVFVTENALFQNKMNYEDFDAAIQNLKRICLLKMHEEKLDRNDNLAKLMMVFRVMTEVVEVKDLGSEKSIIHHPMKYDFEDYKAESNPGNYMVSKLLSENTGQCHSLPLLFLVLAEEMGAEAFWCFSPSHSFVKFKDKENRWYNIELAQGAIVTDDFYMNSGFIKAKAIQTGIFLNPQTRVQTIAEMLNDLSFYYVSRYGYDRFVEENSNLVLRYAPSNLIAYQHRANVSTEQAMYVINACGRPAKKDLPEYPQAYSLFKRMLGSYEKIDSLGYEEMPAEMYHDWLRRLEKEKTLPENQPSPIIQLKK